MKTPPRKESEIQREILRYLQARGIFAWKAGTGAARATYKGQERFIPFGKAGCPDILGVLPTGRFLAIEVKRPGYPPTNQQVAFLKNILLNGGLALIAHSVTEVADTLSREGDRWSLLPPAN